MRWDFEFIAKDKASAVSKLDSTEAPDYAKAIIRESIAALPDNGRAVLVQAHGGTGKESATYYTNLSADFRVDVKDFEIA